MPDSNADTRLNDKNQDQLQSSLLLRYRKLLIIFAHILAFTASLLLSFLVANNMQFRRAWLIGQYPILLVFFVIIKLVIFGFFNQYRGWWRYVGITDLVGILRASLVSTLIIVSLWSALIFAPTSIRLKLQDITSIGQGIFMADLFTTFLLLAGLRMLIRLSHEEFRTIESGRLKRLLIVGAGHTGG